MANFDRVKTIKEMVEGVARRTISPQSFADLRVIAPAPVIDAPGFLGVMIEGAKRFGEIDYGIRAAFTLSAVEQADNDAVIKKAYLASEAIKENVFIEMRSDQVTARQDDGQDIVFRPKATERI